MGCRELAHRQMSKQAFKVSWIREKAAYQTTGSVPSPAVKVFRLLGTLSAGEQAYKACQIISPTKRPLFCCTYITLLLLRLSADHYLSSWLPPETRLGL